MSDVTYLRRAVNDVPVVVAPAEIDITTVDRLRASLLEAASGQHPTVVVDMTRTRFCDSAGFHTLLRAHKRVLTEGGELRLVIPVDGALPRVLSLTGIDRFVPCFLRLEEALPRDGARQRS